MSLELGLGPPDGLMNLSRGELDFIAIPLRYERGGGLNLQNLYFFLQNQYNPPWQKEAVNRGQNWLFNRSNRLLSGRL
jgi:hypothetical protein